jgi:hypothetical protein
MFHKIWDIVVSSDALFLIQQFLVNYPATKLAFFVASRSLFHNLREINIGIELQGDSDFPQMLEANSPTPHNLCFCGIYFPITMRSKAFTNATQLRP